MNPKIIVKDGNVYYGAFEKSNEALAWLDVLRDMLTFSAPINFGIGSIPVIAPVTTIKAHIIDNGDMSVGLQGKYAIVDTGLFYNELSEESDNLKQTLSSIRDTIADCYELLWDARVSVVFDFEHVD